MTFEKRQQALGRLERYSKDEIAVKLERDKWNGHDSNAVKVLVSVNGGNEYHLGYIPRRLAHLAAALIDKGAELTADFKAVTGGADGNPGTASPSHPLARKKQTATIRRTRRNAWTGDTVIRALTNRISYVAS